MDERREKNRENLYNKKYDNKKDKFIIPVMGVIIILLVICCIICCNKGCSSPTVAFYGVNSFQYVNQIRFRKYRDGGEKVYVLKEKTEITPNMNRLPYYERWIYFWMYPGIYYARNSELVPLKRWMNESVFPRDSFIFSPEYSVVNPYGVSRREIEEKDKECNSCIFNEFNALPSSYKTFRLSDRRTPRPQWDDLKNYPASALSRAFFSFLRYKPVVDKGLYKYTGSNRYSLKLKRIKDKSVTFALLDKDFPLKRIRFALIQRDRISVKKVPRNYIANVFSFYELNNIEQENIQRFRNILEDKNFNTYILPYGPSAWIYVNRKLNVNARKAIIGYIRSKAYEMFSSLNIDAAAISYLVPDYWINRGWVFGESIGLTSEILAEYGAKPFPYYKDVGAVSKIGSIYVYNAEKNIYGYRVKGKRHSKKSGKKRRGRRKKAENRGIPYFIWELSKWANAQVVELNEEPSLAELDTMKVVIFISEADPILEFPLYSNIGRFLKVESTQELIGANLWSLVDSISSYIADVRAGNEGITGSLVERTVKLQNALAQKAIIAPVCNLPLIVQVRKKIKLRGKIYEVEDGSVGVSFRTGFQLPYLWKLTRKE